MGSVNWTDVLITVLTAAATTGVGTTLGMVFRIMSKVIAIEAKHDALATAVSDALANPDLIKYSDLARNGQALVSAVKTGSNTK